MAVTVAAIVAGALLALLSGGRDWAPHVHAPRAVTGLALAALAGVIGMFAVRGRIRVLVAAVIALAGLGIATVAIGGKGGGWRPVGGSAGAVVLLAGLQATLGSRDWPSMSTRYEREQRAAGKPLSAWDAIDRGEDPTA
jgi:peptidoglycan/LPS O-acetylase OafA/YrhL